jgi:ABC-2 type transport system ATP-binding protein
VSEISLRGLVKSFKGPSGPIEAVRGVDIEIAVGETVALLGPNGAGKSTTIDMLLGLLEPDAGSVSLFGRTPSDAVAAGAVGAMLQTGSLIRDLNVRELVAMMAALYPRPLPVDEVLELTGTAEIAAQRTQKLSGGQTQRVRAAVALVSNPELLVLDEPTVAMDVEGRRAFWRVMRAFAARGKTILFATHYIEEADAYADRAVLMARGRIVADGPTTEIKGDGRLAHDPRDAARRRGRCAGAARRRQLGRPARRGDRADVRGLRRGDPRAARGVPVSSRHRDRRRGSRAGVPRADRR